MTDDEYIQSLWRRALVTLDSARHNLNKFPDTSANRSYYSAFFAVSALLALEGGKFRKHTAVRAAVHQFLIHTGRWETSLGADYDKLMEMREIADYGALLSVPDEEAEIALERANRIIHAVHLENPERFPLVIE